jgi:hypothetical protein
MPNNSKSIPVLVRFVVFISSHTFRSTVATLFMGQQPTADNVLPGSVYLVAARLVPIMPDGRFPWLGLAS